jgi:hypothetical protein
MMTALAFILFYAIDRTAGAIFAPGPDPATVIASARVDYFWRTITGLYVAPFFYAATLWLSRGREDRAWTLAARLVVPVSVLGAVLSVLFP